MTTKTTGYEFKKFYADPKVWPSGVWHDEELVIVDGVIDHAFVSSYSAVPDDAKVVISGGKLFTEDGEDIGSFEAAFKRWRRLKDCTIIFVECPNDNLEAIKAAISAAGGRVGK